MPWEDEDRDQGYATTSQGMTVTRANHQKIGEGCRADSPPQHSEETSSANPSISDFQPPDNTFLLFKPPSLWYFVMAALANTYRHISYFGLP